jgi:hypothetical protein
MENYDVFLEEKYNKTIQDIDKSTFLKTNIDGMIFLYHYTDINGFLGIFNTKSLWASNAFFLNDSSEIEYGMKLSYSLFDNFYQSIKSEENKEILKEFHKDYSGYVLSSNLFLISFCENGDLLSQWRGYTQNNDGISLRFNLPVIRTLPQFTLYKVIYDKDTQEKIINYLFNLLNDLMDYHEKSRTKSFLHYFNLWITIFTTVLLTFKDNSFSEEKEWRLIYNHDTIGNNKIIEYRIRNNYVLPYVKIEKLNLRNLISGITISPSSNNQIINKSINYYLDMNNYNSINISFSKIPYRK